MSTFNYEYNNNSQDIYQSSESPTKKKQDLSNQNLRPLTIKQINNAQQPVPDGPFKLDGKDLDHISLIGRIVKVTTMSTNTNYTIEDGTGSIDVKIWIETDENDMDAQKRSQWREGLYIRVIGSLRTYHNKKSVMAFHIHLIDDFNEITAHFLEVIKVHLENLKEMNSFGNPDKINLPSFNNSDYAPQQPQYNDSNQISSEGYTPCQQAIINLLKSQNLGEEGMHINSICSMLHYKYPDNEIKESIEWLVSECHLYSTTMDESHVNLVQF